MSNEKAEEPTERRRRQVRIPGFISDDEVGLGDAIKRVTQTFGIRGCGGCDGRAAKLNQWVVFTGRAK